LTAFLYLQVKFFPIFDKYEQFPNKFRLKQIKISLKTCEFQKFVVSLQRPKFIETNALMKNSDVLRVMRGFFRLSSLS